QAGAAAGVGVYGGTVDLHAHVDASTLNASVTFQVMPQGVDHAVVVGQARGSVRVLDRGLVVTDVAAEGTDIEQPRISIRSANDAPAQNATLTPAETPPALSYWPRS